MNKKNNEIKFIETLTFLGNSVLVPIDRIKYIMWRVNEKGTDEISIRGEGEFEWCEHFDEGKQAQTRWNEIIKIIQGK